MNRPLIMKVSSQDGLFPMPPSHRWAVWETMCIVLLLIVAVLATPVVFAVAYIAEVLECADTTATSLSSSLSWPRSSR